MGLGFASAFGVDSGRSGTEGDPTCTTSIAAERNDAILRTTDLIRRAFQYLVQTLCTGTIAEVLAEIFAPDFLSIERIKTLPTICLC